MVDLIIIAVIGLFVYLGYRKGLVKTVFSVVSIFLSAAYNEFFKTILSGTILILRNLSLNILINESFL